MARTIQHRELRTNSSAILREVSDGATIEISDHGEVVAVLVPPAQRPRDSLRVHKATRNGGFATLRRAQRARPVQESIDELRGER